MDKAGKVQDGSSVSLYLFILYIAVVVMHQLGKKINELLKVHHVVTEKTF